MSIDTTARKGSRPGSVGWRGIPWVCHTSVIPSALHRFVRRGELFAYLVVLGFNIFCLLQSFVYCPPNYCPTRSRRVPESVSSKVNTGSRLEHCHEIACADV